MVDWYKSDIWGSVDDAKSRVRREETRLNKIQVKELEPLFSYLIKHILPSVYHSPLAGMLRRIILTLAYLSLSLTGTYAAVINLGLLHLPYSVYVTMVFLIGVTSFLSNITDWLSKHYYHSAHFSDEKAKSIEKRFFLSPRLKHLKDKSQTVPSALKQFTAYAYCEREMRKIVQHSILHDSGISESKLDENYPVEIKARMILAMEARISSNHRNAHRQNTASLISSYNKLKYEIMNSDTVLRTIVSSEQMMSDGTITNEFIENFRSSLVRQKGDKVTHTIPIYMVLRFAYFANRYIREISHNQLSERERYEALRWSISRYIDKKIKKEEILSMATTNVSMLANILVWGSALISSALTVVATAPIKFIAQTLCLEIESILCLWFYFSGGLLSLSSDATEKFIAKVNRFISRGSWEKFKQNLRNRALCFRVVLIAATAISSCYFSTFGIKRLIESPASIGAEFVIEVLSKRIAPQIWPVITPMWVLFALVAAVINLYNDSKFFANLNEYTNPMCLFNQLKPQSTAVESARKSQIRGWITFNQQRTKAIKKSALVVLILAVAISIALSYHVTVMKMTGNCMLSLTLSFCVFLMKYAKATQLYLKVKHFLRPHQDAKSTIIEAYTWHKNTEKFCHTSKSSNKTKENNTTKPSPKKREGRNDTKWSDEMRLRRGFSGRSSSI